MTDVPTRRTVLATLGSGAVALAGSGAATAHGDDHDSGDNPQPQDVIAEVRRATAQYQDVDVARQDGYMQASPCESNPNGEGAMGMHFANVPLDGTVTETEPEVLLYEPKGGESDPDLVGVEYVVPASEVSERPSLFGEDFHGPHDVGAPWGSQYDLHVWCWRANPNGLFASFNPNVSCPDSNHE